MGRWREGTGEEGGEGGEEVGGEEDVFVGVGDGEALEERGGWVEVGGGSGWVGEN